MGRHWNKKVKITEQEKELLELLDEVEWLRPMDLGAGDSSFHSRALNRLVEKGVVERKRRNTLMNQLGSRRGSYVYRLAATHGVPE